MSKERLEEIVKQVKRSDEYAEKGLWAVSDKKIVNLHNEGHINYLIERVQELEEDNKNLQVLSSINRKEHMRIHEQNKRYREALEKITQYGDVFSWQATQARKALEGDINERHQGI